MSDTAIEALRYSEFPNSSDCISRQAAIDALIELYEYQRDIDPTEAADLVRQGIYLAEKKIEQLPSAQPEQRWIPCSERMPEEKDAGILKKLGTKKRSEYVLATVEVNGERMTVTACTYDGMWHWDKKYAFPNYKVIAWMPLPECYRGEEK